MKTTAKSRSALKNMAGKQCFDGAAAEIRTPDLSLTNVFSECLDWVGRKRLKLYQVA